MNFLIFASPLGRAKIMRIHTHEWKLITLIFENEWYYDVIPRYKENKQQTTTNKQSIQTTTLSWMSGYRSESKSGDEGRGMTSTWNTSHHFIQSNSPWLIKQPMKLEEQKLTINTPSAGGVLTNNNRVRRLEINEIIPSPRNYSVNFRH